MNFLNVIAISICILANIAERFSQDVQFGYTRSQVLSAWEVKPCEVDASVISYCVEDGDRISFIMKSGKVFQIVFLHQASTRYGAERKLEELIEGYHLKEGTTHRVDKGITYFWLPSGTAVLQVSEHKGSYYAMEIVGQ
jgi:hypothetical protein